MPVSADDFGISLGDIYFVFLDNIVIIVVVIIKQFLKRVCILRAGECKKALSGTNYNELEGEIMCTTCHRRHNTVTATQRIKSTATDSRLTTTSCAAAAAAAAVVDDDDDDTASQSLPYTVKQHYIR